MKTTINVYIGDKENPKALFNTLLATLFASSSSTPIPEAKVTQEIKISISVQAKKEKNEKK